METPPQSQIVTNVSSGTASSPAQPVSFSSIPTFPTAITVFQGRTTRNPTGSPSPVSTAPLDSSHQLVVSHPAKNAKKDILLRVQREQLSVNPVKGGNSRIQKGRQLVSTVVEGGIRRRAGDRSAWNVRFRGQRGR